MPPYKVARYGRFVRSSRLTWTQKHFDLNLRRQMSLDEAIEFALNDW